MGYCGLDLVGSRWGQEVGCCEPANKSSVHESGKFFDSREIVSFLSRTLLHGVHWSVSL